MDAPTCLDPGLPSGSRALRYPFRRAARRDPAGRGGEKFSCFARRRARKGAWWGAMWGLRRRGPKWRREGLRKTLLVRFLERGPFRLARKTRAEKGKTGSPGENHGKGEKRKPPPGTGGGFLVGDPSRAGRAYLSAGTMISRSLRGKVAQGWMPPNFRSARRRPSMALGT